jgi:sugar phosphate permease
MASTPPTPRSSKEPERVTYRKVTWRLMPFLFVCYVFAYVDRVNVGFAKLQMQQDLSMSDAVYGVGAGIFFLGYFIFGEFRVCSGAVPAFEGGVRQFRGCKTMNSIDAFSESRLPGTWTRWN